MFIFSGLLQVLTTQVNGLLVGTVTVLAAVLLACVWKLVGEC